jgi:nucleoside-triphosphatase THEP1
MPRLPTPNLNEGYRQLSRFSPPTPITAIVYSNSGAIDAIMRSVADHLVGQGHSLAGFVQRNQPCPDRARCDMILEELSSGERFGISEDRGPHARGCMLDVDELLKAVASAARGLDAGADLVMVNKFGKTEAEGGGFRPLIAEALAREVPVLIAVPYRNLDAWRLFAEAYTTDHAIEALTGDADAVCGTLGFGALTADSPVAAVGDACVANPDGIDPGSPPRRRRDFLSDWLEVSGREIASSPHDRTIGK